MKVLKTLQILCHLADRIGRQRPERVRLLDLKLVRVDQSVLFARPQQVDLAGGVVRQCFPGCGPGAAHEALRGQMNDVGRRGYRSVTPLEPLSSRSFHDVALEGGGVLANVRPECRIVREPERVAQPACLACPSTLTARTDEAAHGASIPCWMGESLTCRSTNWGRAIIVVIAPAPGGEAAPAGSR